MPARVTWKTPLTRLRVGPGVWRFSCSCIAGASRNNALIGYCKCSDFEAVAVSAAIAAALDNPAAFSADGVSVVFNIVANEVLSKMRYGNLPAPNFKSEPNGGCPDEEEDESTGYY